MATAVAGYDVEVRLNGVRSVRGGGPFAKIGLPAYEATYSVAIHSQECSSFRQVTETVRHFGPGAEGSMGGLHDWTLFHTLAKWDAARRIAYLEYVSGLGNPRVILVSRLSQRWPGGWWSEDGWRRRGLLAIGDRRGFAIGDLAWTELAGNALYDGRLLGFDAKRKRWIVLAERTAQ